MSILKMKTYYASKPYYIVVKNGKSVANAKIVIGRTIVTDGNVEWFDTESAYKARLEVLNPKKTS